MAVTTSPPGGSYDPIDPSEQPSIQEFEIRLPTVRIDASKAVMTYDRLSDTFLLLLYGRERLWVATGGRSYIYALVDPTTEEFVGWQIEDFLARAVREEPGWVEVLGYAELLGMTVEDVRVVRHQVLGYRGRFLTWLRRALRSLVRKSRQQRQAIVDDLLTREPHGVFAKLSTGA
ncbi:MAG: hypothetical protein M3464_02695 [Chloroflexota bacterium]|nr:hypothetical protein [Chloroflexota bacterium]